MDLVDRLRRAAQALVRRPSLGRLLAVLAVPPAAGLAALLTVLLAILAGPERVRDWCAENVGTSTQDYASCFAANWATVRAPLGVALLALMALAAVGVAALATLVPLAQALVERRRRDALLQGRLARLEDAYARGAVGEGLYAEARAHLGSGLRRGLPGDVARDERRLLAWALSVTAPVLAGAVWLSHWASRQTFGLGAPLLPGAWLFVLLASAAMSALLAVAWWRARREAPAAMAASERDLDALWARVLDEARAASLAQRPREPPA